MSSMDFFAHQEQAHKLTRWLTFYYILAVLFVVIGMNIVLVPVISLVTESDSEESAYVSSEDSMGFLSVKTAGISLMVTGFTVLFILGGTGYKTSEMAAQTGGTIAESMGGRLVSPNTRNFSERQLLNIVEEISIAAGVGVPQVYILENENSINAFAAGWDKNSAAIAVTEGALKYFNRDELQGVIAHEFSHILNGDMRFNIRLIGVLFGLELIFLLGWFTFRFAASCGNGGDGKKGSATIAFLLIGLMVALIGLIGKTAANIIRAAISRQREYLADASAVQFTRNPDGIGNALIKIGAINSSESLESPNASECSHLFFADIDSASLFSGLWNSHPPLKKRIKRILPQYDGTIPSRIKRELSNPPGLNSDGEAAENTPEKQKKAVRNLRRGVRNGQFGLPASPAGTAAAGLGVVIAAAINDTSVQLPDQGVVLTDAIPGSIAAMLEDPYDVQAVLYALLLDSDQEVQNRQWTTLRSAVPDYLIKRIKSILPEVQSLSCVAKITAAELSVSALRMMSGGQYQKFKNCIVSLTEADGKIDLFEFALRMMLIGRLDTFFGVSKPKAVISHLSQVSHEFAIAMGYLAYQGADSLQQAQDAYRTAMQELSIQGECPEQNQCTLATFAASLKKLQCCSPAIKKQFIQAFEVCINFDGKITQRENELIHTISVSLGI